MRNPGPRRLVLFAMALASLARGRLARRAGERLPAPGRAMRAALSAVVLLLLLVTPALADADLETAAPGPGDTVQVVPAELVAEFTQDLDPERSSLELRDTAGATLARGGTVPGEPRVMRMVLPALEPGVYTVRWTTFSAADGHLFRDTYEFTVVAPSPAPATPSPSPATPSPSVVAPSPTAAPTAAPTAVPSATPTPPAAPGGGAGAMEILLPLGAAALVVVGFGVWMFRRRR
ncbi:MAG TPA: copper resistance CopC family protein [Patescibacteria group bacterium]|nr:copper resistance CopC family protein [Patescibacteria group bacterium]